jgi:hypothetical protein
MKRAAHLWGPIALIAVGLATIQASTPTYAQSLQPPRPMLVNVGTGKALDIYGASVDDHATLQQFTPHGGLNQRWDFLPQPAYPLPSAFLIVAGHSGRCLDVPNASTSPGEVIQQFGPHFGANQQFVLLPGGSAGEVVIMNVNSRLCLDIEGHSQADNARVVQQPYNRYSPYQRWKIVY